MQDNPQPALAEQLAFAALLMLSWLTTQQVLPSARFGTGTPYLFSCQRACPTKEKVPTLLDRVKLILPIAIIQL